MQLREDATWALVVPTSIGVRITPENGQAVHVSSRYTMQATSAETNVASVTSYLGLPTLALTNFVAGSPISAFIKSDLRARNLSYRGPDLPQGGPWGYRHQFNIADSGYGSRGPRVWNDRAGEVGLDLDVKDFDLVFTSHASVATGPRHVRTMKPSPIDPDSVILPSLSRSQPPALIGVLIGGNTSSIKFSESDLVRLVNFMSDMHAATGATFYVSNSRRTPQKLSEALVRLTEEADSAIHKFIDVRFAGSGTLRALYASSSAILCTADSSSMVSESVWLRRPTIAITPSNFSLDASELEYRSFLESNGWLRTMPIADLAPDVVLAKLHAITPIVENGLDLLADVFRQRQPDLLAQATPAKGARVTRRR